MFSGHLFLNVFVLFLSEEYLHGTALEVEIFPQLIFYKSFVRRLYILRQIAEESEFRISGRQLRRIFYFHIFAFPRRRRIFPNYRQHHLVES